MTLTSGARLGPYEVVAPIGAGGMGEVYKAKDTRLDRIVALKILPDRFAENPESRLRFEREARTISSLSDPHVCALYDVGRSDTTSYLVMEYLEGVTLADRIAKGPLPPDELFRIASEIASGLAAAHRAGIVHRDLKPGNIVLTRSGVKLLDFGLAKAIRPAPGPAADLTSLPTEGAAASPLTASGVVVGTTPYLSPEQLEGKEADARSDLFALGAVLFEMATGRRAFEGSSQAGIAAAILSSDPPPVSALRPVMPKSLDRLVKACLAKSPEERWQTAHDVMLGISAAAERGVSEGLPVPGAARRQTERLAGGAALAVLLGLLAVALLRPRGAAPGVVRFTISPPEKCSFNFTGRDAGPPAMSPDGSRLAFVATTSEGRKLLFVRALDTLPARPLPGTDGASYPFWSPDGRFVAFFADGKLKKIEASGGAVQSLCDAAMGRGGAWSSGGVIVFAPEAYTSLSRVSAEGGTPFPVTKLDESRRENSHRWPLFLPDGEHFLFLARHPVATGETGNALWVGTVSGGAVKRLCTANSSAAFVPPVTLLYVDQGNLVAVSFDPKRLELTGGPQVVAPGVQNYLNTSSGIFAASRNALAYQAAASSAVSQLGWFDRTGRPSGLAGAPDDYEDPGLSPDGRRLVTMRIDPASGSGSIWLSEIPEGVFRRLSAAGSFHHTPVWSPDGTRIIYEADRDQGSDFRIIAPDGAGTEERLVSLRELAWPTDWSRDGRFLAFQRLSPKSKFDIWVLPLADERVPTPFLQSEVNETGGRFSPDGRWMAYASDETGRNEVYVVPFPGPGAKSQLSSEGGSEPRWRRDGKELFFLAGDRRLMSVAVAPGPTLGVSAPRALFETRSRYTGTAYDVSQGGDRFLVNSVAEGSSTPITVVLNWGNETGR
jgi:Tol biopolymer transport system component